MSYKLIAALTLLSICPAFAVPPEINPEKDLPRFPAVETTNALSTFQVKPGFHLQLVASEPLIVDPIAISFDEHNRMFVVEMRDYSERRDERLGRIKMLEDTNGDGVYDKASIYAEGMAWPTAVFCYDGGVFVISTPDLLYFKDTDGDKKADLKKVLYTGFGNTRDRLNVQGLANSLQWGLDNRIHGLAAPNGGILTNLARPSDKPLDCSGQNFSFNPKTFEMFPENGGGQYGMSFSTRGKKFTCSNSEHIMMWMYDSKYADRNPYYPMPKGLVSIPVDGGAAEVYRISPEEPWRVIRTKWRVSGVATGPIEGGGRASGYFTGATGVTVYRGNAFGADFVDNAFTGDAGGNLVHRKKLFADDIGFKAIRPSDEQKAEFVASKDTWFRPVDFANAPDGCFYIIDMYREVIEHPWSLPEQLKKHIDLNSGNDRGRIYRIMPDGYKQPKIADMGKMKSSQLVKLLEHPNGWHRETAARLLYERNDKSSASEVRSLAGKSSSALGRMHALYVLDGLKSLAVADVVKALHDTDATVREHSLKLAEKMAGSSKTASPELWQSMAALVKDPSTNVVYQLAFTMGEFQHSDRNKILLGCLQRDASSMWMRAAVLSSLTQGAGEMFKLASSDAAFVSQPNGRLFVSEVAKLIGAKNDNAEIAQVLEFIAASKTATVFPLVAALGEGLQRANSSLAALATADRAGNLKKIFDNAAALASDNGVAANERVQAVKLIGVADDARYASTLLNLLDVNQPQELQTAAVDGLGKIDSPGIAAELLSRWKTLTPRVRTEAMTVLLARPERASAVLKGVQDGTVSRTEFSTPQIKFLKNHHDQAIKSAANAVFTEPASKRQDVVQAYTSALDLKGNVEHGRALYTERCSSCHRLENQGFALGPDLITVKNSGKEKMLNNILDPNREVAPQFTAYEIETKDSESVIGLISNETATSVTIKQAYGKEDTIARANIKKMQSQNQSLMPEGLEAGLKPQDIADLLEYISTVK